MSKFTSNMYKAARLARDIEVLASGNPKKIGNRIKNKAVGRMMGRAGVWNKLWRPWL